MGDKLGGICYVVWNIIFDLRYRYGKDKNDMRENLAKLSLFDT